MIDALLAQILVVGLAALSIVPAMLAYLVLLRRLRARQRRLDSERFQRNPQLGDRAGYCVFGSQWFVGEVIRRRPTDDRNMGWMVELEIVTYTALGPDAVRQWRPVGDLTYFGPSTELGLHEGRPE